MLRSLLVLLGLASAAAFMPAGPMAMPLQRRVAASDVQMKALNKPARLAEVRRKYNKHHKSEMRTFIKKARGRAPRRPACGSGAPLRWRRPWAGKPPLTGAGAACVARGCARWVCGLCVRDARTQQPLRTSRAHGRRPPSVPAPAAQTLVAIEEGDYSVAVPLLSKTQSCIDKNVKRGLMHKNTAARKKSQLTLKVKKLEPGAEAPEPVAA